MGKIVIVLGPSGSGKSRSIVNLNPEETVVVNVLRKDLPFKKSRAIYSSENKNMTYLDDHANICNFIKFIDTQKPNTNTIIIDDARYIMEKELFKRAKETGYAKFTEIAQHFQQVIETAETSRQNLTVILMLHDDDVINDKTIVSKKVRSVGKMVEEHYNPLEVVDICLYCKPSFGKNNQPIYQFYTTKSIVDNVEYPAKTPEGMFSTPTIPNDLKLVIDAIKEYY